MCSRASFLNPRASVGHWASGAESVGHRAWAAEGAGHWASGAESAVPLSLHLLPKNKVTIR